MTNQTSTASLMRFASLFLAITGLAVAETWTGVLVDAGCYRSAQNNHNVSDSLAVQDVGLEIQLCHPKAKTRTFAVVQRDGEAVALSSAGNTQAAQLVRQGVAKGFVYVTVNGEMKDKTVAVNSIAPAK